MTIMANTCELCRVVRSRQMFTSPGGSSLRMDWATDNMALVVPAR